MIPETTSNSTGRAERIITALSQYINYNIHIKLAQACS